MAGLRRLSFPRTRESSFQVWTTVKNLEHLRYIIDAGGLVIGVPGERALAAGGKIAVSVIDLHLACSTDRRMRMHRAQSYVRRVLLLARWACGRLSARKDGREVKLRTVRFSPL